MNIALVTKPDRQMTGLLRYALGLLQELRARGLDVTLLHPRPPLPRWLVQRLKAANWDAQAFFATYPLSVSTPGATLCHLAGQSLATLLLVRHLPTVVTVHDIIPYLLRGDKVLGTYQHAFDRLFDLLAMRALGRARRLIASSAFTRRTIIDSLGIPGHRIDVVHLSVNRDLFRPLSRPSQVRETYGLEPQQPLVIFVGSEDPRKNLATLIGAFALVRRRLPHAALLKIGAAHFLDQRQRLLRLVHELGLGGSVRFLDHVPDKDLPLWYNAADVFVLPSLYEGFGYPALEAMSCGTPVIAANRASLPEVVGQGGTLVDPQDEQQMAREITRLLVDPERRASASEAALAQAARFSPQRQADQTIAVYEQIA